MIRRKEYIFIALFFSIFLILVISHKGNNKTNSSNFSKVLIRIENGWAYKIKIRKNTIIYQDNIPGVIGNIPFKNKSDAQLISELVISKLENGELPNVSINDLSNLGIDTVP